jgi:hypothetical protein
MNEKDKALLNEYLDKISTFYVSIQWCPVSFLHMIVVAL